ncbi:hypothetical protein GQX74_008660 [Glossina fuscipes]|nr:hypothetical protein GQX74_008660 [Glossina fuscipes]
MQADYENEINKKLMFALGKRLNYIANTSDIHNNFKQLFHYNWLSESNILTQKGKFVPIIPVDGLIVALVTMVQLTLSAHTVTHLGKSTKCRAEAQQAIVCAFSSVFVWKKISNIIEGVVEYNNLLIDHWSPHGLMVMTFDICAENKDMFHIFIYLRPHKTSRALWPHKTDPNDIIYIQFIKEISEIKFKTIVNCKENKIQTIAVMSTKYYATKTKTSHKNN